jgi:hypothetical protein
MALENSNIGSICAHDISESGLSFLGLRSRQYQVEALLKTPL